MLLPSLYDRYLTTLKGLHDPRVDHFIAGYPECPAHISDRNAAGHPTRAKPSADTLATGVLGDFATHILSLGDGLQWQKSYEDADFPDASDLGGWIILASPDGPLEVKGGLASIFFLNPHRTYPPHRHQPEELYILLSGGLWWSVDDGPEQWQPAGSIFQHAPQQVHGLRTGDETVLGLCLWLGGAYEKSVILR